MKVIGGEECVSQQRLLLCAVIIGATRKNRYQYHELQFSLTKGILCLLGRQYQQQSTESFKIQKNFEGKKKYTRQG